MWLFCFHVYLCTTCMQCSQRPERASHSLELEWQIFVNFCAGRWTCSQPLNHPPFKRCSSTEVCPRCAHVYTTSLCSSVHDPIIHVLCLFLKRRKYLRKLILGPRHLCLFLFWDRVNFVAWIAWNFLVDQAGLKLTEIYLPLPLMCWDSRHVPLCLDFKMFFHFQSGRYFENANLLEVVWWLSMSRQQEFDPVT